MRSDGRAGGAVDVSRAMRANSALARSSACRRDTSISKVW
jgi:hypothetical protein